MCLVTTALSRPLLRKHSLVQNMPEKLQDYKPLDR